jgi:hypothetical protein
MTGFVVTNAQLLDPDAGERRQGASDPSIKKMDLAAMARRPPTRMAIEDKLVLERILRRGFTTVRDAGGMEAGLQPCSSGRRW